MDDEEQEPAREAQVILPESQIGGVWANWARVSHSEHEFTLDFVRLDYAQAPITGVVVARVAVSPLFVTQLIEALEQNWGMYAQKAMPKEVHDAEEPRTDDEG